MLSPIDKLGFHALGGHSVRGRVSIADLFPVSKNRCGIYLLRFRNNSFYIGQAVDAVKRFAQHRKNYDTIEHYWFQDVPKGKLDEVEQHLIQQAEQAGMLLTNKTFVTNVIGETDLDLLVTPAEQEAWLRCGEPLNNDGIDLSSSIEEKFRFKYHQNFLQLQDQPVYPQVRAVLSAYIKQVIPAFKKTEQSFWALSCLPSTNKSTYPRYFALSINGMEVLVAGEEKKTKDSFAFAIVTGSCFPTMSYKAWFLRSYALSIKASAYRAAGTDQYRIDFKSLQHLLSALNQEPSFSHSIREMNLRLMRRGGTIYSPYHCFDLAQDAMNQMVLGT
ncbi:hypothetical protein GCM10011375_18800 [Hymenobacter qilianensis]|uniref:Uncharacterized protein n=3 Tax=Hymenobacter qilianensis TaxID=1385715 RepID=A0ACB5PRB0_9BACT|nr:GIY-YIG nuclease family protein [Hymenobacter qilianensis]QNP52054.1 GIY-YIG nuclease family protein [Hymenobacter qilianensis]GGF64165.1 hypothetical protein GCM10011375_18800 [Hymenobacter qilianensis]